MENSKIRPNKLEIHSKKKICSLYILNFKTLLNKLQLKQMIKLEMWIIGIGHQPATLVVRKTFFFI